MAKDPEAEGEAGGGEEEEGEEGEEGEEEGGEGDTTMRHEGEA